MRKILAYFSLLLITLVTSCTSPKPMSVEIPEPDSWPTSGWKHSTPEARGIDSGLLAISLCGLGIYGAVWIREYEQLADEEPEITLSPDVSDITYCTMDGEQDTAFPVTQAQILYEKLLEVDVDATLVIVQNANHNFKPTGGTIKPTRTQISEMMGGFSTAYSSDSHLTKGD